MVVRCQVDVILNNVSSMERLSLLAINRKAQARENIQWAALRQMKILAFILSWK